MRYLAAILAGVGILAWAGLCSAQSVSSQLQLTVTATSQGGSLDAILLGIETGCSTALPPPYGTSTPCSPDNGGWYETPRLNAQIGRYPDFSGGYTSTGPCVPPAGQANCGDNGIYFNEGYPVQINFGVLDNYSGSALTSGEYVYGGGTTNGNNDYLTNWAKAAADDLGWVAAVDSALNAISGYASKMYYVRVNWEWEGTWFTWSPWAYGQPGLNGGPNSVTNPSISAATWSAGTLNLIKEIRKILPGVKVCVEGPQNSPEQAYIDPIISSVDCLTFDAYFTTNLGSTSAAAWTAVGGDGTIPHCQSNPISSCVSLPFISAYAKANNNKPIIVNEWCDAFNDGYITTQFAKWMVANNVVAQSYWDSDTGAPTNAPGNCHLNDATGANVTLATYKSIFGSTSYSGTFWKHYPIPPVNPPGDAIGY